MFDTFFPDEYVVSTYVIPFEKLYEFWKRMEDGGRKSFTYDEIDHSWQIGHKRDVLVHYLEPLQRDLTLRDAAERNK